MWTTLAGIIPIILKIMNFFGAGINRQQEVEKNMSEWFKKKTNAGAEIAEAQTEQDQQSEELKAMRGKKPTDGSNTNV